ALFMLITLVIVKGGIAQGIEKASKLLMPILFILILLVIIRSVTLPGAMEGIVYYLKPDFSKINGGVVLAAIGQAFFSMSIGWGIMITYGSYLSRNENIISSGFWVGLTDSAVALLAGLMIFPAVFAFGKAPAAGPTLVFQILPDIFNSMPAGGNIIGAIFFLLLCIAALTSAISIVEVPVSYLIDEKGYSRNKSTWIMTILIFIVGIPSALSSGGNEFFTKISVNLFGTVYTGFLDIMDFIFGTFIIVLASLMVAVYTIWVYGKSKMVEELEQGSSWFGRPLRGRMTPAALWVFFIKYICPALIIIVLLNMVGVFGDTFA
ncbi:MAG: sodium-dependent transporter, partial [Cyclobacteriaceae bacterium]|nr:sodium-dependent transporter [Cyclobacteriaceae bacterium]